VFQLPDLGSEPERAADSAYEDPLGEHDEHYRGRWLAGFAPVGNTELVVLVQQRYDEAIKPDRTLARNVILWGGTALALGVLLTVAGVWYGVQRAAAQRALAHL
jgi:hypothetical protein